MTNQNPLETAAYHALRTCTEFGYGRLTKLIAAHGSWMAVWETLRDRLPRAKELGQLYAELEQKHIRLILLGNPDYPARLAEIPLPPLGIYVRGELPPRDQPTLAIVGTRRVTDTGRRLAENFARELARAKVVIVSGLAFGADVSAHTGCLAGGGQAVAVLASGADQITPRTNAGLGEEILRRGGAIVSEYPPGTKIQLHNFLERNRIVSGLAQAVLIIEAPARSGSLATARFALDQNRDVLVLPGPATHPNYEGSHDLIRAGAILVTKPEHVLMALGIEAEDKGSQVSTEFLENPETAAILVALRESVEPLDIDKLVQITKLDVQAVSRAASLLVLAGAVQEEPLGYTI